MEKTNAQLSTPSFQVYKKTTEPKKREEMEPSKKKEDERFYEIHRRV